MSLAAVLSDQNTVAKDRPLPSVFLCIWSLCTILLMFSVSFAIVYCIFLLSSLFQTIFPNKVFTGLLKKQPSYMVHNAGNDQCRNRIKYADLRCPLHGMCLPRGRLRKNMKCLRWNSGGCRSNRKNCPLWDFSYPICPNTSPSPA